MSRGGWRADLAKEIRGLLPLWAACLAALAGALVRNDGLLHQAAIVAYIVGPVAIGAHAIGQEYAYRTLPMLLSRPVDRRRIYLLKLAVAAVMVASIAALASRVLIKDATASRMWHLTSVQILPVVGGLLMAPWLTAICRNSMAGVLLTTSVASLSHLAAIAIVAWRFGISAEAAQAMILAPWAMAMIVLSLVSGWLGLRRFAHLESIDGAASFYLPRWINGADRQRSHQPLRALIVKEVYLQQLTFALAVLFVVLSAVLSLLQRTIPAWSSAPIGAITLLYCMSLAIVIGTMASAEERQLGTLEWQLLQPAPAWQQWLVKTGVALGLALVFALALPGLLMWLSPNPVMHATLHLAVPVVLLTACSLYVSSVSSSGVRGMALSLPAGVATVLFVQSMERTMTALAAYGDIRIPFGDLRFGVALSNAIALTTLPLLLGFGFVNHRSAEQPFRRVAGQVVVLAAAVAIAMGGVAFAWGLSGSV